MHLMSDLNLNRMTTRKNTSSSSLTHKKSYEKRKSLITIPPASIVSVFVDGGLGVYDLKRENWIFLREKVSIISMSSLGNPCKYILSNYSSPLSRYFFSKLDFIL